MACAICDRELGSTASYCVACGFPPSLASLAPDAIAMAAELPSIPPADETSAARAGAGPNAPAYRGSAAPTPDAGEAADALKEALPRVARDLVARLALLERFGDPAKDAEAEMRQAAIVQADGRLSEALHLLRDTAARVQVRAKELFDRLLYELERRGQTLEDSGVRVSLAFEVARMRTDLEEGKTDEALRALGEVDRRLVRVEQLAGEFRSALAEIESLRDRAAAASLRLLDPAAELERLRRSLAESPPTLDTLEVAARSAVSALRSFSESVSRQVGTSLEALAPQEGRPRGDSDAMRQAELRRAQALRALSRGQVPEAIEGLIAVRAALGEASRAGPSPPRFEPPAQAEPVPDESDALPVPSGRPPVQPAPTPAVGEPAREFPAERLGDLLLRARELASRVRSLPPDSPLASTAAEQIVRATELLRARNLDEAERALTDLMRTLEVEVPAEAVP
jgi:hypothetical protein